AVLGELAAEHGDVFRRLERGNPVAARLEIAHAGDAPIGADGPNGRIDRQRHERKPRLRLIEAVVWIDVVEDCLVLVDDTAEDQAADAAINEAVKCTAALFGARQ